MRLRTTSESTETSALNFFKYKGLSSRFIVHQGYRVQSAQLFLPCYADALVGIGNLNSEFSYFETDCPTKVREISLLYYLYSAGRNRIMLFLRVLIQSNMQTALSEI